jgi:hypothetical protein
MGSPINDVTQYSTIFDLSPQIVTVFNSKVLAQLLQNSLPPLYGRGRPLYHRV